MIDKKKRQQNRALVAVGTALTAFIVLFLSTFIASHLTRSSASRSVSYSGDFTRVDVSVSGTAIVAGSSDSSVRADWDLSWSLFRPHIKKTVDGQVLRLSVSCPSLPGRDCSSSVTLSVPANAAVSVSAAGGVQAQGVHGGLKAQTRDGRIDLTDLEGPVDLQTRGGTVKARKLTSAEVRAESRDGPMTFELSAPPRTVHISTRDGRTSLALPRVDGGYALRIGRHGGSEHVTIPSNPESSRAVTIRSHDADLRIEETLTDN
jgi:hypothetical protein